MWGVVLLLSSGALTVRLHWVACKSASPTAVAHGTAFLRGTVTMTQESNLFTVLAHSVPNERKFLVGLVHGSSKHRGNHANGEGEDASVVYCYSLRDCKLLPVTWDKETQAKLQMAEDVPMGLANGSQDLSDFDKGNDEVKSLRELAQKIEYSIDEDSSLDDLMKKLAKNIWKTPEQHLDINNRWKMMTWPME